MHSNIAVRQSICAQLNIATYFLKSFSLSEGEISLCNYPIKAVKLVTCLVHYTIPNQSPILNLTHLSPAYYNPNVSSHTLQLIYCLLFFPKGKNENHPVNQVCAYKLYVTEMGINYVLLSTDAMSVPLKKPGKWFCVRMNIFIMLYCTTFSHIIVTQSPHVKRQESKKSLLNVVICIDVCLYSYPIWCNWLLINHKVHFPKCILPPNFGGASLAN